MLNRLRVFCPVILFLLFAGSLRADETLSALDARRQELHAQYLQRIAANRSAGNRELELHLRGALRHSATDEKTLHLAVSVIDGEINVRRAWAPQYNRLEQEIMAVDLAVADGLLNGSLIIMIHSDGYVPANDESVKLAINLHLPFSDEDGLPFYELDLPEGPGETPLIELAGGMDVIDRTPQAVDLPQLPDEIAEARIEAYRHCRALALALVHNLPLENRLQEINVMFDPADPTLPARLLKAALAEPVAVPAGPHSPEDTVFAPLTGAQPLADGTALSEDAWLRPLEWQQLTGAPVPVSAVEEVRAQSSVFIGRDLLQMAGAPLAWQATVSGDFGLVSAPSGSVSHLAYTTVRLEKPGRVWVALTPWLHELGRDTYTARARLWLNDELVWTADDHDRQQFEAQVILPLKLDAGEHRLAVQAWRRGGRPADFRLALRLGGAPLAGAALAARDAAIQENVQREQARIAENVRSDRVNWRGKVPEARPPLAWDEARGINVAWRTPLPDWTVAAPVVHNGRVFTVGNPHNLYCLDAETGKMLWSAKFDVRELLSDEQRGQLAEAEEKAAAAWKIIEAKPDGVDLLPHQRVVDAYHELANRLNIDCLKFTDDSWRSFTRGHWQTYGAASSAPVSDGEHVWVRNVEGAVACFTHAGERRWMIHMPVMGHDGIPSPLLIDGVLIIEGYHQPLLPRNRFARDRLLVGLNAATGEILWQAPLANPRNQQSVGVTSLTPPTPVAVSDGKNTRTVLATVTGTVVDPRDGTVLAQLNLGTGGTRQNQGYPVAEGNRIVYAGQARHSAMVELHLLGDEIGVRRLWHAVCRHNNYGALLHDGIVWQHSWWFGARPWRGHIGFMELVGLDQRDGRMVHLMEHAHRGIAETTTFPQLLLTHDNVLWAGSTGVAPGTTPPGGKGTLTAIRLGDAPYVLARNYVETYYSNPVADGERLYIRTRTAMLCIGYTGEAGRAFERETVARTIIEDLPPRPVVTSPQQVAGFTVRDFPDAPAWQPRRGPAFWRYRLTDADAAEVIPGLGGEIEVLKDPGADWLDSPEAAWIERGDETALDLLQVPDLRGARAIFMTMGRVDRRGVFRFDLPGGNMFRAWLAGEPVQNDALLRIDPGVYPLVIEVRLQRMVPFRNLVMLPRLIPATDPDRETLRWRQVVRQSIPALQEAAVSGDDSSQYVRLAKELLRVAQEE